MTLTELNNQSKQQARHTFMQCCTSSTWVDRMVDARPFASVDEIKKVADISWQHLNKADLLEAFAGHPKIGDVNSLRAKYANTKALAGNEQALVKQASDDVLQVLAQGNQDYEKKFGFIFIVCATGKSAQEMSDLLQARIGNTLTQELINAGEEQRKIFQIRLDNAFI